MCAGRGEVETGDSTCVMSSPDEKFLLLSQLSTSFYYFLINSGYKKKTKPIEYQSTFIENLLCYF